MPIAAHFEKKKLSLNAMNRHFFFIVVYDLSCKGDEHIFIAQYIVDCCLYREIQTSLIDCCLYSGFIFWHSKETNTFQYIVVDNGLGKHVPQQFLLNISLSIYNFVLV